MTIVNMVGGGGDMSISWDDASTRYDVSDLVLDQFSNDISGYKLVSYSLPTYSMRYGKNKACTVASGNLDIHTLSETGYTTTESISVSGLTTSMHLLCKMDYGFVLFNGLNLYVIDNDNTLHTIPVDSTHVDSNKYVYDGYNIYGNRLIYSSGYYVFYWTKLTINLIDWSIEYGTEEEVGRLTPTAAGGGMVDGHIRAAFSKYKTEVIITGNTGKSGSYYYAYCHKFRKENGVWTYIDSVKTASQSSVISMSDNGVVLAQPGFGGINGLYYGTQYGSLYPGVSGSNVRMLWGDWYSNNTAIYNKDGVGLGATITSSLYIPSLSEAQSPVFSYDSSTYKYTMKYIQDGNTMVNYSQS